MPGPVTELFNKLNNNTDFQDLSYEEQVRLRARILGKELEKNTDFNGLHPKDKKNIIEKFMYQPPAFSDNDKYAFSWFSDTDKIKFNDALAKVERWKNLTPEQQAELNRKSGPGFSPANLLASMSHDYRGPFNNDLDPSGYRTIKDFSMKKTTFNSGTVQKMISHGSLNIANIDKTIQALSQGKDTPGDRYDKYIQKIGSYADFVVNRDKQNDFTYSALKAALPITMFAAEIATMYNVLGVGNLSKAAGLTQKLMGPISNAYKAGKIGSTMARFLTAAEHSVLGGGIGVIYESVKDVFDRAWRDPDFNILAKSMGHFTEYALGDAAGFFLGGIALGLKTQLSKVFTKSSRDVIRTVSKLDDAKELLYGIMTDTVSPGVFGTLPDVTKQQILHGQATVKTFKNVDKASSFDLLHAVMSTKNLAPEIAKDGKYLVKNLTSMKIVERFSDNLDEVADWYYKQLDQMPKLKTKPASTAGAYYGDVKLKKILTANLETASKEGIENLAKIVAPYKGIFKKENIASFSKVYLRYVGASDDIIRSLKLTQTDNIINVALKGKTIAKIPRTITSGENELISTLVTALEDFKGASSAINGKNFMSLYEKMIQKKNLFTPSWIENQLTKSGLKLGKGYDIVDNTGAVLHQFKNYTEAGNWILSNQLSKQDYSGFVNDLYGLTVTEDAGKLIVKKGSIKVGEGTDINSLIANTPDYPVKIPSGLGPKVTIIDNNFRNVVYTGEQLTGSYQQIMDELGNFKQYADKYSTPIPGINGSISYSDFSKRFEVFIPELNHVEHFNNIKSAKKFLSEGFDGYNEIRHAAINKGYRLDHYRNNWVLYSDDAKPIILATKDDLKAAIKNIQPMTWAPELSGLDEQLLSQFDNRLEGFNQAMSEYNFKTGGDVPPIDMIQQFNRPIDAALDNMIHKGAPEELMSIVRETRSTLEIVNALNTNFNKLFKNVLSIKDKFLNIKDRRIVGRLANVADSNWDDILKGVKPEKAKELTNIAENVRGLWGENPHVMSMYSFFDVDPHKFVTDYAPRIRNHSQLVKGDKYLDDEIGKYLDDAFGGKAPENLKAMFEYSRVSDVARASMEEDIYVMLNKYVNGGLKAKYMGPIVKKSNKIIDNLYKAKRLSHELGAYMNVYLNSISGVPYGYVNKMENALIKETNRRLGKNLLPENLVESVTGAVYFASMAWRPWLAVRNSMQILTTLSPRIGNAWVADTVEAIGKDVDGKMFKEAMNAGILQKADYMPIANAELFTKQTKVHRFFRNGMKWYRNSDDYTRVVAYHASKRRFDQALNRFTAHKNSDKFFKEAGGWFMDYDQRNTMTKFLEQGNSASATEVFAKAITNETMFIYDKSMKPGFFRGKIGQLFGQFGTYSGQYIENAIRGLRNGTLKQKVAFTARFLGNSTALLAGFAALGIEAKNFQFWDPAMFTGGPYWDVLHSASKLMDAGREGNEARYKLFGLTTRDNKFHWDVKNFSNSAIANLFIPGSMAARGLVRGMEYWNQGDYYKAFLAFGTFPIKPVK